MNEPITDVNDMRELIGKRVIVHTTLDPYAYQPTVTGVLVSLESDRAFDVRDDDGIMHYGWPALTMELREEAEEMNEDKRTNTPDSAKAFEQQRAQSTGDYRDDTPDPSEYQGDDVKSRGMRNPDVQAVTEPFASHVTDSVMNVERSLDRVRELIALHNQGRAVDYIEALEHVAFIDRWLTSGGRPPRQWTANR